MMIQTNKWMLGALVLGASTALLLACDDDDAAANGVASDAGTNDSGKTEATKSDGGVEPSPPPSDGGDAGSPPRTKPEFLAAADYADLITIDPAFPFGVTQNHAADTDIGGAHWGAHGGPLATTNIYGASGPTGPKVVRWTVGGDAKAPATKVELPITKASGLPAQFFYGADGMLDVPFGALLSYSTGGAPFLGEALLYSPGYDTVKSRAKVNGFYSGVGLRGAKGDVVVYSGLSPFSATAPVDVDNGLYSATLCNGALTGAAPCESHQLFAWAGNSGPVVSDAHGNVFVGASLTDGDTSDEIYALANAQAFSAAEVKPLTLAAINSVGTQSFAAVAPEDAGPGWVVGLGYDENAALYGIPYTEGATALAKGPVPIVLKAIERAAGVDSIYVFTDGEGDLWLALTKGDKGAFLELRRK